MQQRLRAVWHFAGLGALVLSAALWSTGCDSAKVDNAGGGADHGDHDHGDHDHGDHGHDHAHDHAHGPHGGEIIEIGDEEYHAEYLKTDDGTITDAVSEITWTGGKIAAGHYEDFDVAFGQLPEDTGQLVFKTLQTYSDGTIARWIEEPQGGEEPENPAPVLKLTAGTTPAAT